MKIKLQTKYEMWRKNKTMEIKYKSKEQRIFFKAKNNT